MFLPRLCLKLELFWENMMERRGVLSFVGVVVCLAFLRSVFAAPDRPLTFTSDIQPLLQASCVRCHGETTRKGGLDLRGAESLLKGGDDGVVIVPGKPDESKLYEMVHTGQMPPVKKELLAKEQIETIRKWIAQGASGLTSPTKPSQPAITQHEIEPLMMLRCTVCHGLRLKEGGLDLRTKTAMLRGGKSGPAIVLGKPDESLVLKKIREGAMPPNKRLIEAGVKPMSAEDTERLAKWIALGAPEVQVAPDVATTTPDTLVSDEDRAFWAFRAPQAGAVPRVKGSGRVRNAVDAFVIKKLEEKGMSLSPEANRLTLLRRATFDLTGLPPEAEEIERARNDKQEGWYEGVIDRLLASPRYGERWGRYWLDLTGYADSEGKRSADPIRPNAFYYRDYVIRSLNADKPYDRFLLEQIAGDELADYEKASVVTREIMDNLVATGFLRMAPDGTGSDVVNYVPERLEVVADQLQVFGTSVLGLTLQCARCHNHKYDPIPQRDYFRLVDVFKGAFDEHDWLKPSFVPGQTKAKAPGRELAFVTPDEKKKWDDHNTSIRKEVERLKQQPASPERDRQVRVLEGAIAEVPKLRALWDRGEPSPTYVYRRGDYLQPTRLVGPGVPSVLTDGKTPFVVEPPWPGAKQTGRRLALARWLVQPDHPLTARVMVNRVWKHHFGTGIVKTLDNFGNTGARPTHPELLDYLASRFARTGWSIKSLHRLMMTSSVYRQSSFVTEEHEKRDPDNRLLSRMTLRRMEAEVLYDTLLHVAGRLDETRYGPPDPVEVRGDGLAMPTGTERGWRRGIYVRQRRTQVPTLLETFDLPQMNPSCVERVDSTVASQALHLMNNTRVRQLAASFAQRVQHVSGKDVVRQVESTYRMALGRPPSQEELDLGRAALEELTRHWSDQAAHHADLKALMTYVHTLLNSAAFLYID